MHSLSDVFLFLFAVIIAIRMEIIKEHQKLAESNPVFRLDLRSYYYDVMLSVPHEVYIEEKVELHFDFVLSLLHHFVKLLTNLL